MDVVRPQELGATWRAYEWLPESETWNLIAESRLPLTPETVGTAKVVRAGSEEETEMLRQNRRKQQGL